MVNSVIYFLIIIGVVGIGYLMRVPLIVMLAGLGMMVLGFSLWALAWWLSLILVVVGAILVWLGVKS